MFIESAPDVHAFTPAKNFTVGIPKCLSYYSLRPFYAWFFHTLGIKVVLPRTISDVGSARVESNYCYPAEIAHGTIQDLVDQKVDYIFIPHFKDIQSYEKNVQCNTCPVTQILPYYIKKAFTEITEEKLLAPIINFMNGNTSTRKEMIQIGKKLGIKQKVSRHAFEIALKKQKEYAAKA
jgi:predicted nucleotide-binding protein (sugar kinase/HSP70/actin superfamily)